MTGCGCLLLIAALLGLSVFLIFGSTDSGEPIETAAALLATLLLLSISEIGTTRRSNARHRQMRPGGPPPGPA